MSTRCAAVSGEPSLSLTVHGVKIWPVQLLFPKTKTEVWPQGFMLWAGMSENHFISQAR